jgi:hypothetical protein
MPIGLEASDRKLLAASGAVLLVLVVATALLSPPGDTESSEVPSTYSGQSAGAEAAYLLLSRLNYPVSRWEESPTELPSPPGDAVLILANPAESPSKPERDAIVEFVKNGGRVIFTGSDLPGFFHDVDLSILPPDPKWTTYSPNIPSEVTRGAQKVTLQPHATWGATNPTAVALYGDPGAATVVAWSSGKGEVLWWAGATPLTNAGITENDNLTFFLNSVGRSGRGGEYHIYWDEYFHGERESLWSYADHASIKWGLLQIGLVAIAVVFTFSRRSGPIYKPVRVSRLSPLEYVDTLGGLYERAKASPAAVAVSLQRLRYLLTRQLGLPSDTPEAELAQAAEERLGWKNFRADNLLLRASAATRADKLPSREALDLVRDLEAYASKLEIRPAAKEKK